MLLELHKTMISDHDGRHEGQSDQNQERTVQMLTNAVATLEQGIKTVLGQVIMHVCILYVCVESYIYIYIYVCVCVCVCARAYMQRFVAVATLEQRINQKCSGTGSNVCTLCGVSYVCERERGRE